MHYIITEGSIYKEAITLVNMYVPNTGPPKYIKQILADIKGEFDNHTILAEDFNTPLISIDISSRHIIRQQWT